MRFKSRFLGIGALSLAMAGSAAAEHHAHPSLPSACTVTVTASEDENTINAAYQAVTPGSAICLNSGEFGYQLIRYDPDKAGDQRKVVIKPAPGATPTARIIHLGNEQMGVLPPDDLELRDFYAGSPTNWGGRRINFINLRGTGFDVFRTGLDGRSGEAQGSDVLVMGGEYGGCDAATASPLGRICTSRMIGTRITVSDVIIRDVWTSNAVVYHTDGIFIRGCIDCRVLRSKFWGNQTTNIRISNCCNLPDNSTILIEDNWFGCPLTGERVCRANAVDVDRFTPNVRFNRNSFGPGTTVYWVTRDGNCCDFVPQVGAEMTWNIHTGFRDYQQCPTWLRHENNAIVPFPGGVGKTCGPGDQKFSSYGYINPSQGSDMNYRQQPGAATANFGSRLS